MSVACFVVVVVIVNDTTSDMGHGAPSGTATCPGGLAKTDNQNRETPMTMHERERQTKTNLRAAFLAMMLVMMSVHT
jgi:hypothetical protein